MNWPIPASLQGQNVVWGVDISQANRGQKIQARVLRDNGIRFLYHKGLEGESYRDPDLLAHIQDANAEGILTGLYSFARADENPNDDAEQFHLLHLELKNRGVQIDLRPVLDFESLNGLAPSPAIRWAQGWVKRMWDFSYDPLVYTYPGFWLGLGPLALEKFWKDRDLWIAHYWPAKGRPIVPGPWDDWKLWQFLANGSPKDGVPDGQVGPYKPIDINAYRGFYDDFRRFHHLEVALPTLEN